MSFDPKTFDPEDPKHLASLLEYLHDQAHSAESDQDDTLLFSLTQREVMLLVLGMLRLALMMDCLSDVCAEMVERINEMIPVQKPHWTSAGRDGG